MSFELTPEQREPVETLDGPLVLSANAGSGKTRVLVERFVHAVRHGEIAATEILAITFTEKAAGELGQRVRERFVADGEREHARAAEGAFISTIHGFCARLLRAEALAAGVDPGFEIADEVRAHRLRSDAADRAFAALLDAGEEPDVIDVVARYGPDQLMEQIRSVYDRLRSTGKTEPVLPEPRPRTDPSGAWRRLGETVEPALRALEGCEGKTVPAALDALQRCRELLANGASLPPDAGVLNGLKLKGMGKAFDQPDVRAHVEALDAALTACRDAEGARVAGVLDRALRLYGAEYAAVKRREGLLDFEDLQLRAVELLKQRDDVRARWSGRFKLIMVDEFQDTNRVQMALIEQLGNDNVMVVGDACQSIYGFRHADVRIFREQRDAAPAGGALELSHSFRAPGEILGVLNSVFAAHLGEDFVELVAPDGGEPSTPEDPLVSLLLTGKEGQGDGGWADRAERLGALAYEYPPDVAAEARLLAGHLRRHVDEHGFPEHGIAVLLRALANAPAFERALEDVGLPVYTASRKGFFERETVVALLAWLKVLANPGDEKSLVEVLASPLGGLTPGALAHLASARTERGGNMWTTLRAAFCPAEGDADDELAARLEQAAGERLRRVTTLIAGERTARTWTPLERLLSRAIDELDYDAAILPLPDGRRQWANAIKLMRMAAAYEEREGRDLRGFVDELDWRAEADLPEGDAPIGESGERAVRIMSIHAAKGLEFGVVALADLGRGPGGHRPGILVEGEDLGVRLPGEGGDPIGTLAFDKLNQAEKDRAKEEEERVLYVGATRARRRLIFSGRIAREKIGGGNAAAIEALSGKLAPGIAERVAAGERRGEATHGDECNRVGWQVSMPDEVGGDVLPEEWLDPAGWREAGAPGALDLEADQARDGAVAARAPGAASVSFSSLRTFARCGYRFYAEKVLGLPAREVRGGEEPFSAMDRGSLAHTLLERLDLRRPDVAAPDARALAIAHGFSPGDEQLNEVVSLVRAFAGSPLRDRLVRASALRREAGFALLLGEAAGEAAGLLVTGQIDVIARERDGTLIVDYKTDRPAEDPAAQIEREYSAQRRIYALAALRDGARHVEVVHYLLDGGTPVSATFEAADAEALERELGEHAAPLARGDFRRTDNPHRGICHDCPVRGGLCSYPAELTMREAPAAADAT